MRRLVQTPFIIVCLAYSQFTYADQQLYRGLYKSVDVLRLRSMFPQSGHEFVELLSGKIYQPNDQNGKFEISLRSKKGTYIVRLSQDEAFDDVYYIEIDVEKGQARRVRLSFEKPENLVEEPINSWEDSHHKRHPKCQTHKTKLTQLLGNATEETPWEEERIYHRPYQWRKADVQITLECYQPDGKGKMLAESVVFEKK